MAKFQPTPLAELPGLLGRGQTMFGLDLGTKTIGIAIADTTLKIASPLETIKRTKFTADAEALLSLIEARDVAALVLGLPLNMDGSEGPRAQSTRSFASNFQRKHMIPISLWDERLSTTAVNRTLLEADASRKKRGEVVDKMAASFILQGALDRLNATTP